MSAENHDLESILFPKGTDFTDNDRVRLLEQYKLLVQTSETLVSRRQNVNTFFLSVNTLLLAAIGLFGEEEVVKTIGDTRIFLVILGVTGILLAYAWARLVKSYRQLNAGKFDVINLLEKHLPASMFYAEWIALGEGKDRKKYAPFTSTEAAIPWIFGSLYALAIIQGVLGIDRLVEWMSTLV